MPVVDPASNVLDAQSFPPAFKQNLNDVPMVDVVHFRSGEGCFTLQIYTFLCKDTKKIRIKKEELGIISYLCGKDKAREYLIPDSSLYILIYINNV